MGIKTVPQPPYSPDLAHCDFWLFPKLRGCRYDVIEEMKAAVTKVIDMLTLENFHGAFEKLIGTVQQVHCSRSRLRLLRRGLEFHVCTINKSAHTKKVLETYLMILVIFRLILFRRAKLNWNERYNKAINFFFFFFFSLSIEQSWTERKIPTNTAHYCIGIVFLNFQLQWVRLHARHTKLTTNRS